MENFTDPKLAEKWLRLYPPKSELEQKRDDSFLAIITELNRQNRFGEGGIFDCGDIGLLWIWTVDGRWEHRWFIPSQEFKDIVKNRTLQREE